jgi:hypothetical protein
MPKLTQLADVAEKTELLSLFKIAVKRAAYVAIADPSGTAQQKSWAKRVLGSVGQPGQADWYASRVLEGSLVDNAQLRTLIDASLANGTPIEMPDAAFVALVDIWVQRFAALDI